MGQDKERFSPLAYLSYTWMEWSYHKTKLLGSCHTGGEFIGIDCFADDMNTPNLFGWALAVSTFKRVSGIFVES